ncbi:MAG: hypothetical protein R8P61_25300 [Bacteroidia bacterium]|nr:hypothetical protein [Bacteroidia bacterium]
MDLKLYKSVLQKLISLPVEYLPQVNDFLSSLGQKHSRKEKNRESILALAGSWTDMLEEDFEEYLTHTKKTGDDLFGREVEL